MVDQLEKLLIVHGGIDSQQYADAQARAINEKISLLLSFEQLELIKEDRLLQIFSKYYRIPKTNLRDMDVPESIIKLIPKELAYRLRVIPIDRVGNNIIIAIGDPKNIQAMDTIRFKIGYFPKPVLASEIAISDALNKYYGSDFSLKDIDRSNNDILALDVQEAERHSLGEISKNEGSIIKFVNDVLMQCIVRNASDIHFEPYEEFLRIRLRIDGQLVEIARPSANLKRPLISRMKIMAELDIAETRLPQDGAINVSIGSKPVDFRVSTIPTVHGEKIVLRVLDKSNLKVDMTQLGFEKEQLDQFKSCIKRPFGMVLVTGPTGSGKTTTLYSALQELNQTVSNIMTAEDPVEYSLAGINQVQMKSEIGLNFAKALRAFLRQDPDIIMVGEIRDLETAEIAMKAALTGHLVLSTLHTNNAPDTISRLLNMGVENFNLISALNCITAQRLMRKLCPYCRVVDEKVTPQVLVELGVAVNISHKAKAYTSTGCKKCNGMGTKGRMAVHEILVTNEKIKQAILNSASSIELKRIAIETGFKSLRQSGLTKMMLGIVSAEEVAKVTSPDRVQEDITVTDQAG